MARNSPPPCVLTIAGSDSGGGAGVQADARTIHALGGFACMAITAITAQNLRGVRSWQPEPAGTIGAQIKAVLGGRERGETSVGGLPVRAIKTGLIPGAAAVRAIARALEPVRDLPLVVDPVVGSTSGTLFLDEAGLRVLRRDLLPHAALVTPNWPEAEALVGVRLRSFSDAERAALAMADDCGCAVLLKGGHAPGDVCRDCLVMGDGQVHWFESPRIRTDNTHGTGCVLAAAIATELAKGTKLEKAVALGRAFLQRSLRAHRAVKWRGAGPAFPG